MSFHPFIKVQLEDNSYMKDSRDEESEVMQDQIQNDEFTEKMNQFLIILIAYWELFIQNINGCDFTPVLFTGQQLLIKKQYNPYFDNYEDKQLIEKEMVLWINNCLQYSKYFPINPIQRGETKSQTISNEKLSETDILRNEFLEYQYFRQKSFLDALNYYQQWKNNQKLQQNIDQQEIQSDEYYIHQFQVQKQFLDESLQFLKTYNIFDNNTQEQLLTNIIQNISNKTSELQEPILQNYKIYWTKNEISAHEEELKKQKIYIVTEEQKQQLSDQLAQLRSLNLQQGLKLHEFTVLYYKYNFIIKGLLNFERFIYFNDYDIHFERIFAQFKTSKLNINWVAQILQSDEIILF